MKTETAVKPQHTPTPWKLNRAGENLYLYVDAPSESGWPVHNVIANIDDDMGNARANAAFIVRAVNAHEELVEALREILKGVGPYSRDQLEHASNTIEAMKEIAREALAKAEAQ